MFQVRKKRWSSLMRIPSGMFRHCKFDELLTKVSLACLGNFTACSRNRSLLDLDWECSKFLWLIVKIVFSIRKLFLSISQ